MSRYDGVPTGELLSVLPGVVARDLDEALVWAAAIRDRLATDERIVAALRAVDRDEVEMYHVRHGYLCRLCRATASDDEYHTDPDGWHADACPWALAQQTGNGK